MSETTLTSPSTITPLQSMLHELYALLELWKFTAPGGSYSGYTGGFFKLELGGGGTRNVLAFNVGASAWGSSITAFDVGTLGAVRSDSSVVEVTGNSYNDGTNNRAKATGTAGRVQITGGILAYLYAASVAAGAAQTFTEGWRFDSADAKFKIGTTNTDPSGNRTNGIAIDNAGGFNIRAPSSASVWGLSVTSGTHMLWTTDNGASRVTAGSISSNGSTTAYNTTSDRRLKKDIVPAADFGAVIDSLEVVSYGWKVGGEGVRAGFVAQDLVAVAPEAVTRGDEGDEVSEAWGVDYSKLVPMLVKEIQSLRARLTAAGL